MYESTLNKLEEIKSDSAKDCDLTKSCLNCIGISWLITFIAIKVATGLKFGFRVLVKTFQTLVYNRLIFIDVLYCLAVMIAIMASFCGDQKSCKFPYGFFILLGMGSALLLLIPESVSIKLNTDRGQKNRSGEINSLNDDQL